MVGTSMSSQEPHQNPRLALYHVVIGDPCFFPTEALPTSGPATPLLNWQVRQTGYVAELWKAWGGTFQAHTSLSPTGTWGKEAMVLAIMVAALIAWSC